MFRRRLCAGVLVVGAASAAVAGAATKRITLSNGRTFQQKAHSTRTFRVAYPDALKYGGSKYSGRVRILMPASGEPGTTPSLAKVRVLSRGPCQGGSEFCARVRNSNATGTAAVRVRVIARTGLPPGKHH